MSDLFQSDADVLRAGVERDVTELGGSFSDPVAFRAEVRRRLDGSPGHRRTRLQNEDGTWGGWEPF
jgi:hypothetical protein